MAENGQNNAPNLKAKSGGIKETVGLLFQGVSRFVQAGSKAIGFAAAGSLTIGGIAAALTPGLMLATGPALIIGGAAVASILVNKVANLADKKLEATTGIKAQNASILGTFNIFGSARDAISTVGFTGKFLGNFVKNNGNLAVAGAVGTAAVGIAAAASGLGTFTGITSAAFTGAATATGLLSALPVAGVAFAGVSAAATALAATPAIAALGIAAIGGLAVSRFVGKPIANVFSPVANYGQGR